MRLHTFEQLFFHEEKFYFYFWLFYVLITAFYNVSWHQWLGYLEDCGISYRGLNFTTLNSLPTQVMTVVNGTECWFFSLNTSVLHRNVTFSDNDFFVQLLPQCVQYFYYGNDTVYT